MTIQRAFEVALRHHQAGRLAEAETLYRQILAVQPHHADVLQLIGLIAHQRGSHEVAVEWIRKALAVEPQHAVARCNLGEVYRTLGMLDDAISEYRHALEFKPDYPEAWNNLGVALAAHGQLDEAIEMYRRAIQVKSDYPEAYNNLGNALRERGSFDESVKACSRALELKPDLVGAANNLGAALAMQRRFDEAIAVYRHACTLNSELPELHNNFGSALAVQGRLDDAIAEYRRALALKPEYASAHSSLIFTLLYHPDHGNKTITAEMHRWNRQFGAPPRKFAVPYVNSRSLERPLRIGYVSPDFRHHVVGRYLLPLFERHDRKKFAIFCYSGVARPDEITQNFRRLAGTWRNTFGISDERLAETISMDAIDILVDLAQHTLGNRLTMFARKPAPVQTSFAGYPEGTGLEAIEYRISDRYLDADSAEVGARKERVYLLDSFWCYDPRGSEVKVNRLPAAENREVTFGSLNNFSKVNETTLKLWSRVLEKTPRSRIILRSSIDSSRQRALDALEKNGIHRQRVEFVDALPLGEYLAIYHRLDIVLDTFPYNGHTTSLDALWMGVPVVSLAGETAVSRAGLSQLTNLGLPELVAHSEVEYIDIAAGLAANLNRLAALRATLRQRMETSPLMDAPRFARDVEAAYRFMWQDWCEMQGGRINRNTISGGLRSRIPPI